MKMILRNYQKEAVDKSLADIKRGYNPLVALPTGSGKTLVMAGICERVKAENPDSNILIASHVKEILTQNHRTVSKYLDRDVSIYSAGLKLKQRSDITVGGIQSMYRNSRSFTDTTHLIIDECHLLSETGTTMYRTLLKTMPQAKIIGLTATPFRLGSGYIYGDDKIFKKLSYDITSGEKFVKLIEDGYLSDLKIMQTQLELDTTKVRTKAGDFSEVDMSSKFDREKITKAAVKEIIRVGADYKKWLVFAIDIKHAEHIAEELIRNGIPTNIVHSKMEQNREQVIQNYKQGTYRCIVNVNVLTTGFDEPSIDLIALLRPTKSPVLHVQTVGRGSRIHKNKRHCAILDFAGNTKRLGPINNISIRVPKKGDGTGEPITKTCPKCDAIHHPAVRICKWCNHEFLFKHNLENSDGIEVIARDKAIWKNVDSVDYKVVSKPNKPDVLEVTYQCGLNRYRDFVWLNHQGYAKYKALHWVEYRGGSAYTVQEAYNIRDKLKTPNKIQIDTSSKYPLIKNYSF